MPVGNPACLPTVRVMNYRQVIEFLYGLQWFGANFGLERTRRLAELAGNPQERLQFIHVAGTNGKGSVCAMLEAVYRAAGWRTGLYTSPHLVHFSERLQVNRTPPTEAEVIALTLRAKEWLVEGTRRGWWEATLIGGAAPGLVPDHPTFFEVATVMALVHFAERSCELVIWETGLGGRLDATNIVSPRASVITNIALEHTQYLGDTVAKIAAEKSGVIKPGVPVITGATDLDALRVIREVAVSRGAPLTCVGASTLPETLPGDQLSEQLFANSYQRFNARIALAAIAVLQGQLPVSSEAIGRGLLDFQWPGRLQAGARRAWTAARGVISFSLRRAKFRRTRGGRAAHGHGSRRRGGSQADARRRRGDICAGQGNHCPDLGFDLGKWL